MANQSAQRPAKRSGGINATFIGLVFLGICMLIAGFNIGGNIKKLGKTIEEKSFAAASTFSVPDSMGMTQKKYLNETEAGAYLNISPEKVLSLITSGDIKEYIKTDTGYSVSVDVLDEWFDNESYQTKLKNNSVPGADEPENTENTEE
ncbi:MAG: helix-turn-helix domain-containing protein [Oscillospiraceae bacterium]|jgi:hypothetical protein|nr:helix-turn-helix domain-containing protein [Oscillospiraceae bacterium]MCX4256580.1 hypothetical protein [Oscillospiraceae bacterium]